VRHTGHSRTHVNPCPAEELLAAPQFPWHVGSSRRLPAGAVIVGGKFTRRSCDLQMGTGETVGDTSVKISSNLLEGARQFPVVVTGLKPPKAAGLGDLREGCSMATGGRVGLGSLCCQYSASWQPLCCAWASQTRAPFICGKIC
jgi:hypothetical protein